MVLNVSQKQTVACDPSQKHNEHVQQLHVKTSSSALPVFCDSGPSYLPCLWLLWRLSGSCLSGSQWTSWWRPWALVSFHADEKSMWADGGPVGCLIPPVLSPGTTEHARSSRIKSDKTHPKGLVGLACQQWQHPAKGQSLLSRMCINTSRRCRRRGGCWRGKRS